MIKQFYLGCLAHASYLVADEAAGVAAVVDPQRDADIYIEEAARLGVQIRYVFLTHFHADFLAGHLELRQRVGAQICLGARASAEYAFRGFADGEELELGSLRLRVLHTPGHTPESITILVFEAGGAEPAAALTGDTLFAGDVGRPDLRVSLGWSARDLGELLYDSIHQKLLPLPDSTVVYPAHGAGSLCGKNISSETATTMGAQRRFNYALQPMARESFLELVMADQPEAPAYFVHDAVLNTREHPSLEASLERNLQPLAVEAVIEAQRQGAVVLDTRPPGEFARAHWKGALNIPLDGSFATWCGTMLAPDQPLVVMAQPGREREAAVRLGRIGFDHLAGFLEGGMEALAQRADVLAAHARLAPRDFDLERGSAAPPLILDVRNPGEYAAGGVPGSLNIPLGQLAKRRAELPPGRAVIAYCQSGYRSSIAASLIASWGTVGVADLEGGFAGWQKMATSR